jgi:hypothetical protein
MIDFINAVNELTAATIELHKADREKTDLEPLREKMHQANMRVLNMYLDLEHRVETAAATTAAAKHLIQLVYV